jgi:hypothetical protein
MSKPEITGVTVSVEFGFEQDFGRGTKSFASVQSKYPETTTIDELGDVMSDGLDLYLAAWKTLLAARFGTGVIGGTEFKETLNAATIRIDKVRKFLKPEKTETTDDNGQQ